MAFTVSIWSLRASASTSNVVPGRGGTQHGAHVLQDDADYAVGLGIEAEGDGGSGTDV